ncbi:MAG: hypothetical protein NC311_13715 [Muribaculaceae bacterium]|nr:hypothetical protein [Muribaculaceae bacterium]
MSDISIRLLEIAGLGSALQALRLPFGKDCRSEVTFSLDSIGLHLKTHGEVELDAKDLALLSTLVKRGDEHAKVLRGVVVWLEIDAPIYFYRELETYRCGRERLASESTMHIDCKGLSDEELEQAKEQIPMGKMQRTVDMYSYQTLRRIYLQRRNHRLPIWHRFCAWIESLPFAEELILAGL